MSGETLAGGSVDVAIIGAGAAGVGAARRLQALRPDLSLVLLEASDRIGGRARTVHPADLGGLALDLGCGWLHGARTNAWTGIAEEIGLTVDRTPAPWSEGGLQLQRDDSDAKAARIAANTFLERIYTYEGEEDAPLSALLAAGNPWNGYIHALGTFLTGAELDRSSAIDQSRYDPGPSPDWRGQQGYGTLVATYAAPLPVHTEAEVRRIDHSAADYVVLSTARGDLRAKAVVIAVSTNILAAEKIAFWPPLPGKIEAASQLPLGLANKLFLQVRTPEAFPADAHILGSYHSGRTGSYQLKPFGAPVIETYFAGDLAHDLEREGIGAAFDFSVEQLKRFFGSSVEDMLSPAVMSAWASEPFVGGSYSYAVPGASDQRQVLAAPHDQRLFFAGEACSVTRYSTAHGAYETGFAAAEAIAKTLV
ncbi:FAD-dependent oxidoreductase [Agrobacterium rhizogenes]|uniref:flavin monoamine oxidase family protein n=1 Tax=Rhizobium rhizogenes TaxID=359 RepID=UPI001571855D|nr:NAD(P)/FAD-dependent oxidoreductase [Rhizobium rhizogenes]NTI78996.1 FAD-dependent oxidoreductase [Rhizobium rhizogenes]